MLGKVDPRWIRAGTLRVNGDNEELLTRLRPLIGYVPQEDIMHRDLSVYENIKHSAACRLPRNWSTRQVEDHVNAVILAIQLAHVQDSPIGDETNRGISGKFLLANCCSRFTSEIHELFLNQSL